MGFINCSLKVYGIKKCRS